MRGLEVIENMARPERFELPTFWFVGGFQAPQQTTAVDNSQRNQQKTRAVFGWRRTVLYLVHGQLHGQFSSGSLPGLASLILQPYASVEEADESFLKRTLLDPWDDA